MLDFQTEHLDNHTARLTVKIDAERLEKAMRDAGRRIAKKARIKGFRPGKAPYNVILNLYGQEYVLAEAVDVLGQDIYKEALEATEIEPYAPGTLEDVKQEDGLTLIFSLPKRPEVDLGDYRDSLRVDYSIEEITDKQVEDTLESLRENQAETEDVERPAEFGDQVTFGHIQVEVLPAEGQDSAEDAEAAESEAEEAAESAAADDAEDVAEAEEEAEEEHDHAHGETDNEVLLHRHNWQRVLSDTTDRDLFPGFSAELVGLNKGDEKVFTLTLPEDYEDADLAGRTLKCEVHVESIQSRNVPEWSDELITKISDEEFSTIDELREDVHKQLINQAETRANNKLIESALDQLTGIATLHYPEEVISDHADDLLEEMDRNLQQQGIKLDDYLRIMNQTRDDLKGQYRDSAIRRAERALVLGKLLEAEQLTISAEDVTDEIKRLATQWGTGDGAQEQQFIQFLNTPQSRASISSQLINDRVLERLMAIAKGENPPLGPSPRPEASAESEPETETEPVAAAAPVAEAVAEPVTDTDVTPASDAEVSDEQAD